MLKHPGDIKVISPDRMCFWVNPITLEPRGCSTYDAYAFSDPEPGPSMGVAEWNRRRCDQRAAQEKGGAA